MPPHHREAREAHTLAKSANTAHPGNTTPPHFACKSLGTHRISHRFIEEWCSFNKGLTTLGGMEHPGQFAKGLAGGWQGFCEKPKYHPHEPNRTEPKRNETTKQEEGEACDTPVRLAEHTLAPKRPPGPQVHPQVHLRNSTQLAKGLRGTAPHPTPRPGPILNPHESVLPS